MTISLEQLRTAVGRDAAIRRVQKLQPVGGPGDKISLILAPRRIIINAGRAPCA
jgi:hypothetical protein